MEGIHGVDTSWLHHSRGQRSHSTASQQDKPRQSSPPAPAPEVPAKDDQIPPPQNGIVTANGISAQTNGHASPKEDHRNPSQTHAARRKSTEKMVEPAPLAMKAGKEQSKTPPQSPGLSRKSSWMSSLTSKFSGNSPTSQTSQNGPNNGNKNHQQTAVSLQNASQVGSQRNDTAPISASPKSGSSGFLSSALRRLSSSSGTQMAKSVPNGGICPRKVLNIDPHRERCQISDLQPAKLRRVAFCVDVEIAAPPKYKEEDLDFPQTPELPLASGRKRSGSAPERGQKTKAKVKERSEGEALKHPNAVAEIKENAKQRRASPGDMFEIPDIDDTISATSPPNRPTTVTGSAARSIPVPSQKVKSPGVKSPAHKSSPHHDFGPNGMFEVDEWDEILAPQPKTTHRRGSTGGAVHHDFGRDGMFEIPTSSEDEGKDPRSSKKAGLLTSPETIAQNIGKIPVGHIFSEKLMFEIPEIQDPEMNEKLPEIAQPARSETNTANDSNKEHSSPDSPVLQPATPTTATADAPQTTRKKEKKKRSEEERKERKEKKRQAAIANGTIPVELTGNDAALTTDKPKPQSRPTTDPLRIYRRCCQLRETSPLPRVADQLSAPNACDPLHPSVVLSLDLSNQTVQLEDIVTLGDWLAVVPVQKLILENCGLTDEAVRVVLSGLLAAKTTEQAKHNRHLAKKPNKAKKERLGVISKLSLKNNKMIGKHGWLHIGLFLNMSRTLKAIDLSMIPFPRQPPVPTKEPARSGSAEQGSSDSRTSSLEVPMADPMDTFWKCMAERTAGEQLEEVVMGDCNLSPDHIERLIDAVMAFKVSRLGLAHNNLETRSYHAIARYLNNKSCMGLDLGGNTLSNDEDLQIILNAIDSPENQMFAISLADCNLTPSDLKFTLPVLARLPNFRFLDLSHNRKLFESSPSALGPLSKWLPRMKMLKRIGLNDVSMQSEQAISLAEICPEIPLLAHLSILENPNLTALASAKDEAAQEEACALYASLMAATRVSKTIVCIDIDVPSKDNSEVVKALAKQVVAYSLRNLERSEHYKSAAAVIAEPHGGEQAVSVPDVLLHLVGHVDQTDGTELLDETAAPDQDYLVGGTGVVKALSVVLGQRAREARRLSREVTPVTSGTSTPKLTEDAKGKARDMSKNLLDSARKIRHRLQPALVRAGADAPEQENTKRLGYLDTTLQRMIERFEDEYPECRPDRHDRAETFSSIGDTAQGGLSSSFKHPFSATHEAISIPRDPAPEEEDDIAGSLRRASRHGSDVSLASRQLANEEGRLHRFGQRVRREVIPPEYGTSPGEEPTHVTQFRVQLENLSGEQIRSDVEQKGMEQVLDELKITAEGLKELQQEDPETWRKCRDAGICGEFGDSLQKKPVGEGFAVKD